MDGVMRTGGGGGVGGLERRKGCIGLRELAARGNEAQVRSNSSKNLSD